MSCSFDYTVVAVCGQVGSTWMTVDTPTDRPKLVRNRCVIEVLSDVFVLSIGFRIFCWYRVGIGVFVIGLSQISFFFSDMSIYVLFFM